MKNNLIDKKKVALGARLKSSSLILTLGLKPNFQDYSKKEKDLIINSEKIFFPTAFYADLFNAMGKRTFPSFHTYKFAQNKIKQTAIFQMLDIPHPKTRVFFGKKQKLKILNFFNFPFIAKKPRGSSKGRDVFLITNDQDLCDYLKISGPAYIQAYYPVEKDMRIIIIGKQIALSYWRISKPEEFRTNISIGGSISFNPLPSKALDLAMNTALKCGWDDVGIDIIEAGGKFFVLEANMKYGTKGFKKAGLDYKKILEKLIVEGKV